MCWPRERIPSIIFGPNPSGNAAILFVPFRKEVLQHILYSPNMNDVTFPLISPEIYSRYFHHSEFDILDNKSPSEKPLS